MTPIELLLIAIGLAMDAFAVSVGKGIAVGKVNARHALTAGAWFGGFQALMPIIGYFLGRSFSGFVENVDHWIDFGLLAFIGINMIREAVGGDEEGQNGDFGLKTMFVMAVATSIDALAIGITIAFLGANIWISAAVIGIVTLLISAAGVYLGSLFGSRLGSRSGIIGGVILIAIGLKILIEHLC